MRYQTRIATAVSFLAMALFVGAGKYKISTAGKSDIYVPTLEQDGKTLVVESVLGPGAVPIGAVIPVMPSAGVTAWQPPATGVIKDGFMRADGTVITAMHKSQGAKFSVGTTLPNMISRYPRGNTTSGAVNGSNTVSVSIPAHYHNSFSLNAAGHSLAYSLAGLTGNTSSDGNHPQTFELKSLTFQNTASCEDYRIYDALGIYITPHYLNFYTSSSGSHGHSIASGTTNIAHSHPASVVSGSIGNQGGSNGDGAFGGTVSPGSGSAGNNEPAYTEVVWVIRVK